jgi:omega-6 fatty acid desaturase (delta-12 desaturase)
MAEVLASAAPSTDPPGQRPNVPTVRGQIPPEVSRRSPPLGLAVVAAAWALYAATLAGVLAAPWWPVQLVCSVLAGVFVGTLFVSGHDACHGSLTPSDLLNRILGRVCFLPSLTPYTSWEFAHNRIHHSYTNLRGRDYAWAPFAKDEYDRLPPLRRLLERHYRSLWGLGSYYLVEYWWKHLLFQSRAERQEMKRPLALAGDVLLLVAFAGLQVAGVVAWSQTLPARAGFWSAFTGWPLLLVLGVVAPFLIWNWLMGFAIFQHHNHPRIVWYADKDEWDYFAGQVEATVHMQLPAVYEWLSAHIMQHTAHHVNPKIPLYRLSQSQHLIEQAYPRDVVVERWTLRRMAYNMAVCKLYDYENHRWLNFQGRGTTEPHPAMRARNDGRFKAPGSGPGGSARAPSGSPSAAPDPARSSCPG